MPLGSRTWLNVGLLVLVVLLGVLAVYLPGIKKPQSASTITELNPAQIKQIRIERKGETISLTRQELGWKMLAPLSIAASQPQVQDILDLASAISVTRYEAGKVDLAKLKLDPPQVRLRLDDLEMDFGSIDALDKRRYVRIGTAVHLINDSKVDALGEATTAFISTALLPPASRPVQISLPRISITRQSNGGWDILPRSLRFSDDKLNKLAEHWQTAEAVKVVPYQERKPINTLDVTVEDEAKPLHFEVMGLTREPGTLEMIMARPDLGIQYSVTLHLLDSLLGNELFPKQVQPRPQTP